MTAENSAIEKLQKENAALKRQLERQRSDLTLNDATFQDKAYMSVNTGDFVKCMAIMHEIGKSMMLLDGEKIRATIEGGKEKTIIKVKTLE